MFDWSGLKNKQYFILKQVSDPLKYCNYSIPIPLGIGLPFMPCDLPNQYTLHQSNQNFDYQGDIYLTFEQQVNLLHRVLIPASHRPWTITGKDYYHHTPYIGIRNINLCLSPNDRPEIKVYYKDKYIGYIKQITILNCCCFTQKFQQFQIYNNSHQLIYKVVSKNYQKGQLIILPCYGFDTIKYDILKFQSVYSQNIDQYQHSNNYNNKNQSLQKRKLQQNVYNLTQGQKVGQIIHLWNGCSQYTSKNDKYGIYMPQQSNQQEKCLLIYCTLFIDYLLFQNF